MCGNHDWYYHLPGQEFDAIRQDVIDGLGLSNPVDNFPWELAEHEPLQDIFARYNVYGQHGDKYDMFNRVVPEYGQSSRKFQRPAQVAITSSSMLVLRLRKAWTKMLKRLIPEMAFST